MNWFSILHDSETETAHVMLLDEIGCMGESADNFQNKLIALAPKRIELTISSRGGDWHTGLKLHKTLSGFETHVVIVGACYSSAVLAAMAGQTIRILPTSRMLVHSPCAYTHGTADELLDAAIRMEEARRLGAEIICARTRQSAQIVRKWLSGDTWFTAAEAVLLGLADELQPPPEPRKVRAPKTESEPPQQHSKIPTAEEKLFIEWLIAFGTVTVGEKEKFTRMLGEWCAEHVLETSDHP